MAHESEQTANVLAVPAREETHAFARALRRLSDPNVIERSQAQPMHLEAAPADGAVDLAEDVEVADPHQAPESKDV